MAGIMDKILMDSGSMNRTPYMVCGMYKGYYVTVHMNQGFLIRINYKLAENMDLNSFKNRAYGVLNQLRVTEKKVTQTNVGDYVIEVKLMPANLAKNTTPMIDSVTNHLIGFLQTEGAGTGCQMCGAEYDVSSYDVNGAPHFLCSTCARQSLNQLEAERQSKSSVKSNLPLGIIGALIGSLPGVALWAIIFQAHWIAGVAGMVIFLGAMKGYEMLGKNVDRKGVVVCALITVIMIFLANDFALRLSLVLSDDMTFAEVNRKWSKIMKYGNNKAIYIENLVIGYFLSAIGLVGTIKQSFKSAGGSYTMKKM
ncbi:MAG: hypothetical protein K2J95_03240 [Lachnospiraceae bacterium]|nr:hypothetical protein [Lachnospiraceae bacterium]